MSKTIREYFETRIAIEAPPTTSLDNRLKLATAALLIEISKADHHIHESEKESITNALSASFGMSSEETKEIIELADQEVNKSISIYEFTRLINDNYTMEQKKHVIGLLWQIALSDNHLEALEEYLIRKTATLLHVSHDDFINEKLKAQEMKNN